MHCQFMEDLNGGLVCKNCGAHTKNRHTRTYRKCGLGLPSGFSGTHLKMMLSKIGLSATEGCKCNSRAAHMNRMGDDWCEQNIDTIVSWLREEASNRGLPFLDVVGRMLVRRAISNARKEAERAKNTT